MQASKASAHPGTARTNSLNSLHSLHSVNSLNSFSPMGVLVVQSQQIGSEVAGEVPPDRMDVIGVILGVVVLDQEGRTLDAIVVRLTAVRPASPGERNVPEPGSTQLSDS